MWNISCELGEFIFDCESILDKLLGDIGLLAYYYASCCIVEGYTLIHDTNEVMYHW